MKVTFEEKVHCKKCGKKTKQKITIDGEHVHQECQVENCGWKTETWDDITITRTELDEKTAEKVPIPWTTGMNPSKRYEIALTFQQEAWIPFPEEINKFIAKCKEEIKKVDTKQIRKDLDRLLKWKVRQGSGEEVKKATLVRIAQDELKRRKV